jgi:superfamily II DNA or RNA helicase
LNLPQHIKIRSYQEQAYKNWKNNYDSGIFAMATGTGKTITALNCVYQRYKENKSYNPDYRCHLLILVPTQPLLEQWVSEVEPWGIDSIFEVSGKSDWKSQIQILISDFEFGLDSDFVVITTYRSFTNSYFQKILTKLPEDTILIADEAHNIGQPQVRKALKRFPLKRKIGLSATPKRIYDPEGTEDMELFFNDSEPYIFNLFMDEAIELGSLCRYEYYPVLVELEKDELEEYIELSKRLAQLASKKQDETAKVSYEKLLLKRKRIINKARGKLKALSYVIDLLIEKSEKIEYCFIYAPSGEWKKNDETTDQESVRIIRQMQKVFDEKISGIRTHVYLGETKNRKSILDSFEKGEINALLAINCLDEGVNVPRTGIGIFTSSTGNPRQYIQRRGRLLRNHPDKNRAVIFDMIVIPKVFEESKKNDFFRIQKNLVKNELMRVGYFAKLSENFYDAKEALDELCKFYNLDLDTIIKKLEE